MAGRWTKEEEERYRKELYELYVLQNKTISEVAHELRLRSDKTVYVRLGRLGIPTCREKKARANNKRGDIVLPKYSRDLAELFGILLGDGHITHFQIWVTLGTKEAAYAEYVRLLLQNLFGGMPRIAVRKTEYKDVYLGSTMATKWLFKEGLVANKVSSQVDVPAWVFTKKGYMQSFLRGFFDTDGSIYKLRHGAQISLTNYSLPLLCSLQKMLQLLRYHPSAVSGFHLYLTRTSDIRRFFNEVKPANKKHQDRYKKLYNVAPIG